MKLEKQVTSLEISKRLKELEVKQESLFGYLKHDKESQEEYGLYYNWGLGVNMDREHISAFTVAELGEMLPEKVEQVREKGISKTGFWLNISFDETSNKWRYSYANHKSNEFIEMIFDLTEADARGKMLIHLLENKLISF